ncbi:MAG: hypothetical protein AAF321_03435 [Pseudomonadota bacterium]
MKTVLSFPILALTAGGALAQSAPPWDLATTFDPETRETRFTSVTVEHDGALSTYETDSWIRPELTGYAQAKAPIIVALGEPAGPDVPITRGRANQENMPDRPMDGARRLTLVTDDLANSMLLNIADDVDGLTLRFPDGGVTNGPGPDVIFAEASLPAGRVSGGCPGVPAPGADVTLFSIPGGGSTTLGPDAFIDFGPAGPQMNHGTREMGEADFRLDGLDQLTGIDMRPLASIDYMKVYATGLDLSDLGVPEGAQVETLVLSSSGALTETDNGPQLCWTADPILVVGLPVAG